MSYIVICSVALIASGLTLFSGFGLGTLLLPAFVVFFPAELAVTLTAVVHFLNGLFKLVLVGRKADWRVAIRFGLPAIVAAFAGARVLLWMSELRPIVSYELLGRRFEVTPLKLAIALLMAGFAALELSKRFKKVSIPPKYLPIGGVLTGFFGGLSGHQGALRSVFLLRAGLTKEAFIATGAVIASLVDVSRLATYAQHLKDTDLRGNGSLLVAATTAAFVGAFVGSRLIEKVTLRSVELLVATLLGLIAVGLAAGLL